MTDDMLDAYEALISHLGHEVVTEVIVESGPEAVRADALVVDLQRPREDSYGLRLIRQVRADPHPPERLSRWRRCGPFSNA